MEDYEKVAVFVIVLLIAALVFAFIYMIADANKSLVMTGQANRDCVQLGYAGGEIAPDMPNALRCWTIIILVDEKGQ